MKRKLIIVSASIVALALIVALGVYAQGGKSLKSIANEQTDKNLPDNCKKCPSATTCFDANNVDTNDSTCETKSADSKTSCDKSKCEKCDKKESCAKSKTCATKECPHKSAAGCEKKDNAQGCTRSKDCNKECEKKTN